MDQAKFKHKLKKLKSEGYPQDQALAISYSMAGETPKEKSAAEKKKKSK